jgi:C1A family cysteine protease
MKQLAVQGVCRESDWPYDISKFTEAPPAAAVAEAPAFHIKGYYRVFNLLGGKQALATSHPVVIGISVYDSFESSQVAQTGIVPLPDVNTEQLLGGHCVLVLGYDDASATVMVRNSWGTGWGQSGYFTLPYEYFNPARGLVSDMWTAQTGFAPMPVPVQP